MRVSVDTKKNKKKRIANTPDDADEDEDDDDEQHEQHEEEEDDDDDDVEGSDMYKRTSKNIDAIPQRAEQKLIKQQRQSSRHMLEPDTAAPTPDFERRQHLEILTSKKPRGRPKKLQGLKSLHDLSMSEEQYRKQQKRQQQQQEKKRKKLLPTEKIVAQMVTHTLMQMGYKKPIFTTDECVRIQELVDILWSCLRPLEVARSKSSHVLIRHEQHSSSSSSDGDDNTHINNEFKNKSVIERLKNCIRDVQKLAPSLPSPSSSSSSSSCSSSSSSSKIVYRNTDMDTLKENAKKQPSLTPEVPINLPSLVSTSSRSSVLVET